MKKADYIKLSGYLFGIVGLIHLGRVFLGWPLILGGFLIPAWASFLAGLILWYLAYASMKLK
ncbi:MAG: hypothetical protein UX85_C0001G0169 [Candidatus Beckwithbacteria bacterium GW2011_GWB1_47_15]|uniref:Uncharacterized protein n=1 Tax=Candidatus Beckwithbacteria bacterium GW2011_GWB1_47_15 TaxID=1618371 RepID=A0A0G1UW68_9BACT|nr:MAG: hypothetical protein UY43_C0001G0957 [Candidatus Beckwithbacteria bacterium GW2011_GWC1_49_16]AQS30806.1 hypothetical protein [uncultured bacterium]KKU35991.1 MAG: hypothetical protein UX50_C0001G0168 [Candidatus Beckwithbacteria bacterium GW2011_GWA1_46_30]KKU61955.1 MAG: hypothetical protein UX85_C0001G0169 [Candidatus Beckwithbacteria bacterium GW2011_GWB1_47_15]KKU72491.1 MAG: hypothetical protein UX97_C0001G0361 [Candidatus Beckwithbacteria bacterium GW2011_GWA2_47_25]KKW04342.1 M